MWDRGADQQPERHGAAQVDDEGAEREVARQARRHRRVHAKARHGAKRAEDGDAHPRQQAYQCRPQRATITPATANAIPAATLVSA